MKKTVLITVVGLALAVPGFAQMGGGGMGGGGDHGGGMGGGGDHGDISGGDHGGGMGGGMGSGGMMGGAGMIVVADDGSVLLNDGHGFMGWQDDGGEAAELVNIDTDGTERWRVAFESGQPMMSVTAGDLVVVTLAEMGGWDDQGDHPGNDGMGGGGMGMGSSGLIGLDLVSGVELWTFDLEEASMLRAQISEDGSTVYVIASDAFEVGAGSMGQGDSGMGGQIDSTLYALDRFGNLLWSLDLGQD